MATQIKDGGGSGRLARVNAGGQLEAKAEVLSELAAVSRGTESAFMVATDFAALTSTGIFSGVLFYKNTSQTEQRVYRMQSAGTVLQQWRLIKNPTAGTLISAGTARVAENLDSSSPVTLVAQLLAGAEGLTVTDGLLWTQWVNAPGHAEHILDGAFIVQPGDSLALVCKPAAAADVCASLLITG
jgi:hypothetical protein